MSLQRTRPIDALQRIMTSFKQFEKKLDKLQDDVNYHGQTLTDLRVLVTNFSTGTVISPDVKIDDVKHIQKKTTAIQYDRTLPFEEPIKTKRKNVVQPLPSKLKAKSFQCPKFGIRLSNADAPFRMNKLPSSPKGIPVKHSVRPRKAEAPRKTTTLRNQKGMDKKRAKIPK